MSKENIANEVQRLHEKGYSFRDIALIAGISKSSVGRITQKLQASVLGTASGTYPTPVSGTAGTTVPGTSGDAIGTLESVESSEKVGALPSLSNTEVSPVAGDTYLGMFYRISLQSSYRDFLHYTQMFLSNNLVSEELALSLFKSRQSRVGELIDHARSVCSFCLVDYDELFMAYVLERLHAFFGQV